MIYAKPGITVVFDQVNFRYRPQSVDARFFPDNRDAQAKLTVDGNRFTLTRRERPIAWRGSIGVHRGCAVNPIGRQTSDRRFPVRRSAFAGRPFPSYRNSIGRHAREQIAVSKVNRSAR